MSPAARRLESSQRVAREWQRLPFAVSNPALLVALNGGLDIAAITRLMNSRDDRRVNLRE
jgi:hypothetical protein